MLKALADGLPGHARDPETLHRLRLRSTRLEVDLIEVGEDQLALAPGVTGVDHFVDVVALELLQDYVQLLAGLGVARLQLEGVRRNRKIGHAPALEALVVVL